MDVAEYLSTVASQFAAELQPVLAMKGVTANSDLLGRYTEAAVTRLVRRIVSPMHVCTGEVLDYPLPPVLRQLDLVIWAPFPAPAVFEVEGFGLVPRSSAFGVIEVKRSNYSGVDDRLQEFFEDVDARRIVSDQGGPVADYRAASPGLAVISRLEAAPSGRLKAWLEARRVVAIFEGDGDDTRVRPGDVLALINFLHYVTWRYRVQASGPNYPQITA